MSLVKSLAAIVSINVVLIAMFGGIKPALASEHQVTIVLTGVKSDQGTIRSVLCTSDEKFPNTCAIRNDTAATKGVMKITFTGVKPGNYAIAAFHDENNDKKLNISRGRPKEGLAFSKDALGTMGPPKFKQSEFEVKKDTKLIAKFRYL